MQVLTGYTASIQLFCSVWKWFSFLGKVIVCEKFCEVEDVQGSICESLAFRLVDSYFDSSCSVHYSGNFV